jgi:hypothetical protein
LSHTGSIIYSISPVVEQAWIYQSARSSFRGSIEDTAEDTTAINEYDYAATIDTEILQIF